MHVETGLTTLFDSLNQNCSFVAKKKKTEKITDKIMQI